MHIYKKFLGLSLALFMSSFMFLTMLQIRHDQELMVADGDRPWGVNFHPYMVHIQSRDVMQARGYVAIMKQNGANQNEIEKAKLMKKPAVTITERGPSSSQKEVHIWPSVYKVEGGDRIVEQLYRYKAPVRRNRTVVLVNGPRNAQSRLQSEGCLVQDCTFTSSTKQLSSADAVIFFNTMSTRVLHQMVRPPHQIWGLFMLESPHHTGITNQYNNVLNWTATYRRDSVLVTPYEKFVHFANYTGFPDSPARNFAQGKTKLVAWFVSNCHTPNGRANYVKELQKYIQVDIYGGCGTHKCPRSNSKHCFDLLNTDYKFYLAFENSNCKDYITEKLYWNALGNNIVPVVMGAHPDDYKAVAPPHSFIHVDDFASPKDLAEYLHRLDKNDNIYNGYFHWKGTGEFINTRFWCRLCNLVHAAADRGRSMVYTDFVKWWNGPGVCAKRGKGERWASWRGMGDRGLNSILSSVKLFSNESMYTW